MTGKKKKEEETEQKKPPRKIAMCGTAPSTRDLIPWETDWEVWGQADAIHDVKNAARWFDIAPYHRIVNEFPEYHEWQKKQTFPIFMREHYPDIPTSVPLPFNEVGNMWGMEFMSATITWMMGLALMEHIRGDTVGCIGLFGYDMALDGEFFFQRPGIKHMEWICREHIPALGFPRIDVLIPKGSDLCIPIIPYPFADDNVEVAKIRARKRDIERKRAHCRHEIEKTRASLKNLEGNLTYLDGAMEDVNYFERQKVGHHKPI